MKIALGTSGSGTSGSSDNGYGTVGSGARSFTVSPSKSMSASSTSIMPAQETNTKSTNSLSYWRLTEEEMRVKKEKVLFFKCNGKFSFGH